MTRRSPISAMMRSSAWSIGAKSNPARSSVARRLVRANRDLLPRQQRDEERALPGNVHFVDDRGPVRRIRRHEGVYIGTVPLLPVLVAASPAPMVRLTARPCVDDVIVVPCRLGRLADCVQLVLD